MQSCSANSVGPDYTDEEMEEILPEFLITKNEPNGIYGNVLSSL